MSNKPRIEEPGGYYHVTANAVDKVLLFRDDDDRIRYHDLFAEEVERSEWTILEYTFLSTHLHVLLQLRKCTLSTGFQRLQSRYARLYNRLRSRRGVVWQRRFHSEMLLSERHLFETIRYVALNAPRAGMVEAAEDWPWCSYGSAVGVCWPDPLVDEPALLGLFSRDTETARQRLQAFVEEKDPRERWRQTRVRGDSDAEQ